MIIFIFLGTVVVILLVVAIIFFVFKYHNAILLKENSIQEEKLAHQKLLLKATLKAEEKERQRLSKNVHDEMGTYASLLKMNVSRLTLLLNQDEKVKGLLSEQKSLITNMTSFARNISLELSSQTLIDFGLVAGIEELITVIERNSEIKFTFQYPIAVTRLGRNTEIQLLRIIKELFNNIIKHAKPKDISIDYSILNNFLIFSISHNGEGISSEDYEELKKNSKGLGLKSIETRVHSLHGNINYLKEDLKYRIELTKQIDHE